MIAALVVLLAVVAVIEALLFVGEHLTAPAAAPVIVADRLRQPVPAGRHAAPPTADAWRLS